MRDRRSGMWVSRSCSIRKIPHWGLRGKVFGWAFALVFALAALLATACADPSGGGGGLCAAGLRTEYRVDPLGIGTPHPRLSWILESESRNVFQSGYRILVANSERRLARDEGSLWDSGRVSSAETLNVAYAGIPLDSGQAGFWKVMVWDKKGRASPWSRPAPPHRPARTALSGRERPQHRVGHFMEDARRPPAA